MHLYELDQHSAIADEGATSRRPATTISTDNGATWSTPSYLFSYATTIAPSVSPREGTGEDGRIELGVPYTVAPHQTNATFWRGLPGSWTAVTGPSTSTGLTSWVNVAQSDFGETLAVWPDNCDQEFGCDIKWAWSNNEGSSWTTGTLAASGNGTYSKPEIAYDPSNDRFVLLYIDVYDSFIRSMHAPAIAAPGWSAALLPDGALVTSQRFRFLGGVVFDHAPGSNKGLVVASYWSWPSVPLYEITQFNLKLVSGSYVLDGLVYYMNNSLVGSYRTRRPFGIARRRDTGIVLVAWRGMTTSDRLMVATKTGLNAATAFTAPSLETGGIRHGVDVAFSRSTNAFVAGVTWP